MLLDERNYKEALKHLKRLVDLEETSGSYAGFWHDDNYEHHIVLYAMCAAETGDFATARKVLEKVNKRIAVKEPEYHYTIGRILLASGSVGAARKALERAITKSHFDPRYHLHLASAYKKLRRFDDMNRELEWVRKIEVDGRLVQEADAISRGANK
jgi:tetratricopeptide (TPR) repeat protein